MSRLQAAGLVETLRGRGSFVLARPSTESFGVDVGGLRSVAERVELLEFRTAVETEAAALAALRRDDDQLAAVRRAADAFARAATVPRTPSRPTSPSTSPWRPRRATGTCASCSARWANR